MPWRLAWDDNTGKGDIIDLYDESFRKQTGAPETTSTGADL
jgi:hypothetical protein